MPAKDLPTQDQAAVEKTEKEGGKTKKSKTAKDDVIAPGFNVREKVEGVVDLPYSKLMIDVDQNLGQVCC